MGPRVKREHQWDPWSMNYIMGSRVYMKFLRGKSQDVVTDAMRAVDGRMMGSRVKGEHQWDLCSLNFRM